MKIICDFGRNIAKNNAKSFLLMNTHTIHTQQITGGCTPCRGRSLMWDSNPHIRTLMDGGTNPQPIRRPVR